MNNWYVIKTKPKQEKHVRIQLVRVGYELFLPEIQSIGSPKPLFPSYLFVRGDLANPAKHRMVRYTRGVSQILGNESGPQPIDSNIIEALQVHTSDGSLLEQELLFKAGDTVRVSRGLLKDLTGIIERHFPAEQRVQVLFKWWSTSMRARLKYTHLEKAA